MKSIKILIALLIPSIILCGCFEKSDGVPAQQQKDPLPFVINIGQVNENAKDYIEHEYDAEMVYEDGKVVSRSDDDTVMVEIQGSVYGRNADFMVFCGNDAIITYIGVTVEFDNRDDELIYYHSLIKAANEAYGEGTLYDEDTEEESISYIFGNEGESNRKIVFVSPEKLETGDNTYYFVNIQASPF